MLTYLSAKPIYYAAFPIMRYRDERYAEDAFMTDIENSKILVGLLFDAGAELDMKSILFPDLVMAFMVRLHRAFQLTSIGLLFLEVLK